MSTMTWLINTYLSLLVSITSFREKKNNYPYSFINCYVTLKYYFPFELFRLMEDHTFINLQPKL